MRKVSSGGRKEVERKRIAEEVAKGILVDKTIGTLCTVRKTVADNHLIEIGTTGQRSTGIKATGFLRRLLYETWDVVN